MLLPIMDFVLLPTLKIVLIYPGVCIENELMIIIIKHQYYYYLVSTIACNGVLHFHNQLIGTRGELTQADLCGVQRQQ